MIVRTLTVKLYAPWVHSLKEKRMIVKSLIAKLQGKFNVSICEAEDQDLHQSIVLGMAIVSLDMHLSDSILDNIINFIENNTEAQIIEVQRDLY